GLQDRLTTLSAEMSSAQSQGEVLVAQGQQTLVNKFTKILTRIEETTEQLRKGTIEKLPTTEQANALLAEIEQLEQHDCDFQQNIPQLRDCIEKGNFLHTHTTALKEKIKSARSSQDKGEQLVAQAQQKILDEYLQMQPRIENIVKQLLAGNKEASKQAKTLLTQIKQLEQREQNLQRNIPILLELEQKQAALQAREEALKSDITSFKNRLRTVLPAQWQQKLLEALQEANDHISEFITQLIDGVNDTPEQIEAQRKVQIEKLSKITAAETALQERQEMERKENERVVTLAGIAWDEAMEIDSQAKAAKVLADRTQTEGAYNELHRLAQNASNAWFKAAEAKKVLLSTASQADKASLTAKINTASNNKVQYDQLATEALKNAKEIAKKEAAKKEADRIAVEIVRFQAEAREKVARIIGQIEEAKQASKEKRGGENSYLWDRIATKLEQARDSWNRFNELVDQGKKEKSVLWRKVAEESEASAQGMRRVAINYSSGNKEAAQQLDKEAWSTYYLSDASTWSLKSEEAQEKVNQVLSKDRAFWINLAEQYKIAADYEKKALEAHLADKEAERNSCTWIGRYTYSSADRKLKAMEARAAGRNTLAVGYTDAAETSQKAAEQQKQALTAYIAGKTAGKQREGNSWGWSASSLQAKADYQVKAIEAQEEGKTQLVVGYREAAAISEQAADYYEQSALVYASGKDAKGYRGKNAGDVLKKAVLSLQNKVNYQAKAYEAQKVGKTTLASGYQEAAATSQRAAEQYKLAAESIAAEGYGSDKPESWEEEGSSLQKKADYQAKASEAQEAGKTMLAAAYREAAAISQRAADQQELSVEKKAAGTWMIKTNCSWKGSRGGSFEGLSLQAKADYQIKAAEAQEAGKTALARGCREAAATSQQAADQHRKAVMAFDARKEDEGERGFYTGESIQEQADYQAKAAEAQEAGPLQVEVLEKIEETKNKALEARAIRQISWNWIAGDFGKSTKSWELAFNLQQEGKTREAAVARETAATYQRAAELKKLGRETMEANKNEEGNSLYRRGELLQEKVECSVKEAKGTLQRGADHYEQAALAYKTGKDTVGHNLSWAGASLKKKADYQVRAREDQDEGKATLSTAHRMAAETSQGAADQYEQAALAYKEGKETAGAICNLEGDSLQLQADYQAKA
ncbi:MAG TPA: hypothetical protein VJK54_04425, partial [Chthoniobacterales bacterium]|nr:hypothetical protein [Chthoniobacterales bacterium]